jgi:deoxycytidine triphosphate deaminase
MSEDTKIKALSLLQSIPSYISLRNLLDEEALYKLTEARNNQLTLEQLLALEILRLLSKGAILSDLEIENELGKDVFIYPFNKAQLQPSTYDITLGEYFFRRNPNRKFKYLSPKNGEHIIDYWNVIPDKTKNYGALSAIEIKTEADAKEYGVKVGDRIITLEPGELILGHIIEFIGGRNSITTEIKARSTMGRCGVTIAKDSGQGDNGFTNKWTLEVQNHTQSIIVLTVGETMGQIKFQRTGTVRTQYYQKGNYQTSENMTEVMRDWNCLAMIPSPGAKLIREMEKK